MVVTYRENRAKSMMKQVILASVASCMLAACATQVPNSARPQGVGFADYEEYQTTREGVLTGPGVAAAPLGTNNVGISDEQNFDAVASRETIQSDAARLERQRQAYRQIAAEPLPQRTGEVGPNIVEYALQTTNAVGQPIYDRGRVSERRYQNACAEYTTSDQAQQAFLEAGGPERDRRDLDPDGDGFACGWNPAPFRVARQ